jgi:hypothetical protein
MQRYEACMVQRLPWLPKMRICPKPKDMRASIMLI